MGKGRGKEVALTEGCWKWCKGKQKQKHSQVMGSERWPPATDASGVLSLVLETFPL